MMQILVPLAGRSPFFPSDHYFFPKCLVEVDGRPMIERVVENLATIADDVRFIFVVSAQEATRFSLDRTLNLLTGGRCAVVRLHSPTRGALCSALMAIDSMDAEAPLVIANADQVIDANLRDIVADFRRRAAGAGVIVFDSIHPRWSYVDCNGNGDVLEAAEKRVISTNAVAGLYYFGSARSFAAAAMQSIGANASIDGSFYIAPCLNEVIMAGESVVSHRLDGADYHSFYSPDMIKQYEDMRMRDSISSKPAQSTSRVNLVIPAAGEGSRFRAAGYPDPKPFIKVKGVPMIRRVIDNVAPADSDVHLLLRKEHVEDNEATIAPLRATGAQIHEVDRLTEGTACTLLLIRDTIDGDRPLLVANSDQYVDFSIDRFVNDCIDRDLDGSILVFRDVHRDPKWSFARVDQQGLVREVAEKKPISDLATVGIYLFRRGSEFVDAAIDMIARNDRVNNEFYTCPVYNYLIAKGARIGVHEIDGAAMHGLGTPADLNAFLDKNVVQDVVGEGKVLP